MVKKYLKPSKVQVVKGTHRSQWISSKGLFDTWLLQTKGSLFYLEKWRTSQQSGISETFTSKTILNKEKLE